MDAIQIEWVFSGAVLLLAAFFYFRARSESERASGLALEVERVSGKLQKARTQLEKASAERQRGADREAQSRRKLDKAKKRAGKQRDDKDDLPGQLRKLESRLRLREDDLERVREELARIAAAAASTGPSAKEVASEKAMTIAVEALAAAERELPALRERTAEAEARASESAQLSEKAGKESARFRHKSITQDKLYNSMRLELEAKKDMLRTQTEELERLRAFKVVLGTEAASNDSKEPAPMSGLESREEVNAEAAVLAEMESADADESQGDDPVAS